MTIKWSDRLVIDGGLIDQDHMAIITVTNQFLALRKTASKEELALVLADLEHYARSHFWRESRLQDQMGFREAKRQAQEHLLLVGELQSVVLRFHAARASADMAAVVEELSALLHGWLIDHILKSDIEMVAFRREIAERTRGMAPLERAKETGVRTIGTETLQAMSIDGGVIDDDHRRLVDIINTFIVGTAEGAEGTYLARSLETLAEYTHSHFAREEQLQAAVGFPYHQAHKQSHQDLLASLAGFERVLAARPEAERARNELCAMLKRWLFDHVGKQDARMRPYVEAMRGPATGLRPMPHAMMW